MIHVFVCHLCPSACCLGQMGPPLRERMNGHRSLTSQIAIQRNHIPVYSLMNLKVAIVGEGVRIAERDLRGREWKLATLTIVNESLGE